MLSLINSQHNHPELIHIANTSKLPHQPAILTFTVPWNNSQKQFITVRKMLGLDYIEVCRLYITILNTST